MALFDLQFIGVVIAAIVIVLSSEIWAYVWDRYRLSRMYPKNTALMLTEGVYWYMTIDRVSFAGVHFKNVFQEIDDGVLKCCDNYFIPREDALSRNFLHSFVPNNYVSDGLATGKFRLGVGRNGGR